jgi:hypothetical protein
MRSSANFLIGSEKMGKNFTHEICKLGFCFCCDFGIIHIAMFFLVFCFGQSVFCRKTPKGYRIFFGYF